MSRGTRDRVITLRVFSDFSILSVISFFLRERKWLGWWETLSWSRIPAIAIEICWLLKINAARCPLRFDRSVAGNSWKISLVYIYFPSGWISRRRWADSPRTIQFSTNTLEPRQRSTNDYDFLVRNLVEWNWSPSRRVYLVDPECLTTSNERRSMEYRRWWKNFRKTSMTDFGENFARSEILRIKNCTTGDCVVEKFYIGKLYILKIVHWETIR